MMQLCHRTNLDRDTCRQVQTEHGSFSHMQKGLSRICVRQVTYIHLCIPYGMRNQILGMCYRVQVCSQELPTEVHRAAVNATECMYE